MLEVGVQWFVLGRSRLSLISRQFQSIIVQFWGMVETIETGETIPDLTKLCNVSNEIISVNSTTD